MWAELLFAGPIQIERAGLEYRPDAICPGSAGSSAFHTSRVGGGPSKKHGLAHESPPQRLRAQFLPQAPHKFHLFSR